MDNKKKRLWRIRIWLQIPKKLTVTQSIDEKGKLSNKLSALDIYPERRLFRDKEFTVDFKRSESSKESNNMLECFVAGENAQPAWELIEGRVEFILNILSFTLQIPIRKTNFEALDLTPPHVLRGEREALFGPKVPSIQKDATLNVIGDKWKIGFNPRLMASKFETNVEGALRWYTKGIAAETVVDQFAFYWIALESLSMPSKSRKKVFFRCQVCKHEIEKCPKCSQTTEHFPDTKERLQEFVVSKLEKPLTLFERLWKARNMMFHGRNNLTASEVKELLDTVYELKLVSVEALKLQLGLPEDEVPMLIAPDSIHITGGPILGGTTKLTKEHIKSFLQYKQSLRTISRSLPHN